VMRFAERLVSLDRQREILELLTPQQLAVVALVVDGFSQAEAARMLGISRQAAQRRLRAARRRVLRELPELAGCVEREDDGREVG